MKHLISLKMFFKKHWPIVFLCAFSITCVILAVIYMGGLLGGMLVAGLIMLAIVCLG